MPDLQAQSAETGGSERLRSQNGILLTMPAGEASGLGTVGRIAAAGQLYSADDSIPADTKHFLLEVVAGTCTVLGRERGPNDEVLALSIGPFTAAIPFTVSSGGSVYVITGT
ncbi:hypothetical protein [uncultured Paraglaciecola sp.]|uniref:hypothetical protein n=1 Tax=uncultured Paraglaciecola sp. TaxID=1765024 RepID=UPI002631974A|nr:hypothetical protein [uncultured Paraglaciecola sp.]